MVGSILLNILGPILILIVLGALVRWRFRIDVGGLSKLNIYLFVPAFVFEKVATSTLSWTSMGGIVAITILQVLVLGGVVLAIGKLLRIQRGTLAAIALAVMFYNSGNYGLPLAELAYPRAVAPVAPGAPALVAPAPVAPAPSAAVPGANAPGAPALVAAVTGDPALGADAPGAPALVAAVTGDPALGADAPGAPGPGTPAPGAQAPPAAVAPASEAGFDSRDGAAVQAFVLMVQNLLTFTVGLSIAAWAGSGGWAKGMITVFRLPILPGLAAALLARWWFDPTQGASLPAMIAVPIHYLSGGLVPIALITLGAQLASNPRWPRWRPISMVLGLRLLYAPVQMAAMLWAFAALGWVPMKLWPWPAELLILTAAVPTAVNTLLLTLELGGEADLAADCVFWTTVFSCLTITAWLVAIRLFFS